MPLPLMVQVRSPNNTITTINNTITSNHHNKTTKIDSKNTKNDIFHTSFTHNDSNVKQQSPSNTNTITLSSNSEFQNTLFPHYVLPPLPSSSLPLPPLQTLDLQTTVRIMHKRLLALLPVATARSQKYKDFCSLLTVLYNQYDTNSKIELERVARIEQVKQSTQQFQQELEDIANYISSLNIPQWFSESELNDQILLIEDKIRKLNVKPSEPTYPATPAILNPYISIKCLSDYREQITDSSTDYLQLISTLFSRYEQLIFLLRKQNAEFLSYPKQKEMQEKGTTFNRIVKEIKQFEADIEVLRRRSTQIMTVPSIFSLVESTPLLQINNPKIYWSYLCFILQNRIGYEHKKQAILSPFIDSDHIVAKILPKHERYSVPGSSDEDTPEENTLVSPRAKPVGFSLDKLYNSVSTTSLRKYDQNEAQELEFAKQMLNERKRKLQLFRQYINTKEQNEMLESQIKHLERENSLRVGMATHKNDKKICETIQKEITTLQTDGDTYECTTQSQTELLTFLTKGKRKRAHERNIIANCIDKILTRFPNILAEIDAQRSDTTITTSSAETTVE